MAKKGAVPRQFMLGVVQTAEGLPCYHAVFGGYQAEGPTLLLTLRRVLQRWLRSCTNELMRGPAGLTGRTLV